MADDSKVISGTDYQLIAQAYGNLKARLDLATGYLYDAVLTIAALSEVEPSYDLMPEFYNTYIAYSSSIASITPFLSAVRKLNSHVISRGNYTNIDEFLAERTTTESINFALTTEWGTLSAAVGDTISSTYLT